MVEFEQNNPESEIGALPPEPDPQKDLTQLALSDERFTVAERSERLAKFTEMTADELIASASEFDSDAARMSGSGLSDTAYYKQTREYARLLLELAEAKQAEPQGEMSPEEAIAETERKLQKYEVQATASLADIQKLKGRAINQDATDEEFVRSLLGNRSKDEKYGYTLGILKMLPDLKKSQTAGVLTNNRLCYSQACNLGARELSIEEPSSETQKARIQEEITYLKREARRAMREYQIFRTAATAYADRGE